MADCRSEIGMSLSVAVNFAGSGLIALFTPLGLYWGHSKLLGVFSGLSFIAAVLVRP